MAVPPEKTPIKINKHIKRTQKVLLKAPVPIAVPKTFAIVLRPKLNAKKKPPKSQIRIIIRNALLQLL